MDSSPRALYSCLLSDLECAIGRQAVSSFSDGAKSVPWPDITPTEMACLSLSNSFLSKLKDDPEETADALALSKFLSCNERVGTWRYNPLDSWDDILVGELKQVIYEFFYPEGQPLIGSFDQILDTIRVGPGASIGAKETNLYHKLFSSKLTTTDKVLYRAYRNYIRHFPSWSLAEQFRADSLGEMDVVEGNRLRFVPKKREVSRTICIEPTLNMSFQLGIGRILEDRLRSYFGIDIGTQPDINRELARRGSIDDGFATIDLESASDSLCLEALQTLIPREQLPWFLACRSSVCELPDGRQVRLNMISTMGNGYTFPLQTMLFAAFVVASARARGFPLVRPRADRDGTFGVFGDDIILPMYCHYVDGRGLLSESHDSRGKTTFVNYGDSMWLDLHRYFRLYGFIPNSDKSFSTGAFRESCGSDFFRGQNVRGVYLKTLRTMQSRFVAINTLNRWSARTGVALPRTIAFLLRTVRLTPVPRFESDDSGVKVPFSMLTKYRSCKRTRSVLYRRYVPRPSYLDFTEESSFERRSEVYNPFGLLLAFLNGVVRSGKVARRSSRVTYRSRFNITPYWDYDGPVVEPSSTGQRWETAVSSNLGKRRFEVV